MTDFHVEPFNERICGTSRGSRRTAARLPIDLPVAHEAWDAEQSLGLFASSLEEDRKMIDAVARQERVRGIMIGICMTILSLAAWWGIGSLATAFWPVRCDGTASILACSPRLIGGGA